MNKIKKLILLFFNVILISYSGIGCPAEFKDGSLLYLVGAYFLSQQPPPAVAVPCVSSVAAQVSDPLFGDQWHLDNTAQSSGGIAGEDINVLPVWSGANRGQGVQIVVTDDGVELTHEDLSANVNPGFSKEYSSKTGSHGTAVAGTAAANDSNGLGLRGVAPAACLASYDLLNSFTYAHETDAMTRNAAMVDVMNNSWGPPDGNGKYYYSDPNWKGAVEYGLASGRGGLGIVYVWAAGNGGLPSQASTTEIDNSNYDGYANFYGVMAICAVGNSGTRAYYSEKGANLWVCTPSMGNNLIGISTTDRTGLKGYNDGSGTDVFGLTDYSDPNYLNRFNGTSAAAPVASGVAALIIKANPLLTWRDVKIIMAQSARKNDAGDADWKINAAGYNINHKYGFGVADAGAAVTLASSWTNVPAMVTAGPYAKSVNVSIPDNNPSGITDSITVSGSVIGSIEYIEVVLDTDHPYAGDLNVTLTGPSGTPKTTSIMAETHPCANSKCGSLSGGWMYGTARHLGETADGTWTLKVADGAAVDTGVFTSWSIKFYGH